MALTDKKIHPNARFARRFFRPGRIPDGVLTPVAITINATPEDFDVSAFLYALNGNIYYHPASTGHSLSATHATGIAKWLGALVMIDQLGTISTIGAPDTGDQDHETEAAALASLVNLCPVGKVAIGTITLLTDSADWDGNTDAFNEADLLAANLLGYKGDRRLGQTIPGGKFRIASVRPSARAKSGVAFIEVVATKAGVNGVITHPRIEVDRRTVANATVITLRVGGFLYVIDGVVYYKAPENQIAFTAAHVVALDKWGAILVQINAAGTVSTKVTAATQTTPLTAANSADARALLPAADAANIAIGTIVIEAGGAAWDANTDDLVATSDLEALDVLPETRNRLLSDPGLAMDEDEEEDFKVGTFTYVIDGVVYTKNAAAGIDFTAAHVCALDKYLAVLVMINAAGTVSTKVPLVSGRSQTASQGFDTPNLAIAALPSCDPDKVEVGYILIAADGTSWTANTDDMEAASDVDGATFVSREPAPNTMFAVEGAVFGTESLAEVALAATKAAQRGDEDGQIVVLIGGTTGAVTAPVIDIEHRPYPMSGE